VVSFTPQPLYSAEIITAVIRSTGVYVGLKRHDLKKTFLSLPLNESRFLGRPTRSLFGTPTGVHGLQRQLKALSFFVNVRNYSYSLL
jgi:hypothetical protein